LQVLEEVERWLHLVGCHLRIEPREAFEMVIECRRGAAYAGKPDRAAGTLDLMGKGLGLAQRGRPIAPAPDPREHPSQPIDLAQEIAVMATQQRPQLILQRRGALRLGPGLSLRCPAP
jgi:hypothetical protein